MIRVWNGFSSSDIKRLFNLYRLDLTNMTICANTGEILSDFNYMQNRLKKLISFRPEMIHRIMLQIWLKRTIRAYYPNSHFAQQLNFDPRYLNHGLLKVGPMIAKDNT